MASRTVVLMRPADGGEPGAMTPLGSRAEVTDILARHNTSTDGSDGSPMGMERLHGPGIIVQIPTTADDVTQAMVTIHDEDMAWPVLSRLCREAGWSMVDPESGRKFM